MHDTKYTNLVEKLIQMPITTQELYHFRLTSIRT